MNKRGVSHLEMIISFVLFVGFVASALYFFTPGRSNIVADSVLSYAVSEIKDNASTVLESYSIVIDSSIGYGFLDVSEIDFGDKKLFAETYNGEKVPANKEGDKVYLERITVTFADRNFVVLKASRDMNPTVLTITPAAQNMNYRLASSKKEIIFSEMLLEKLAENYEVDYEGLKERFNLPSRSNFGFRLSFGDGSEIKAEKMVPGQIDIFADASKVRVLRESGEVVNADFVVRVW